MLILRLLTIVPNIEPVFTLNKPDPTHHSFRYQGSAPYSPSADELGWPRCLWVSGVSYGRFSLPLLQGSRRQVVVSIFIMVSCRKTGRHRIPSRAKAIPGSDWIHDCEKNKPAKGMTQHSATVRPVGIQVKSLARTNFTLANGR